MCDQNGIVSSRDGQFSIKFNQDFTSLSVASNNGYRIFTLSSVNRVDEIFCSNNEDTWIAERLFSSSLVAVVTTAERTKLKVCHFKKGTEICNYSYPSKILAVKLNRARLIVCLNDSIYIHNIRDMKLLHSIRHISANDIGLCSLSLNSHLAYPISGTSGELQIFDADTLMTRIKIKAHDSPLSALNFSYNGILIATASEKGTVIRVFCVKNGQKVHEFRRGVKRHVRIASLNFSCCANYVSISSNTETIHVFKIDAKSVETAERLNCIDYKSDGTSGGTTAGNGEEKISNEPWVLGLISKAVSCYLPTHMSDVLSQDRAFATVQLTQPGLRYECVVTKLEKETKLLVACEDGFLYIYDFDDVKGGDCKLIRAHDLRTPLEGVTEVDMRGNDCEEYLLTRQMSISKITPAKGSYAGVLKGRPSNTMSDSDKCRDLSDALDYPARSTIPIFDEMQFPPVATVRAE